MPMIAVHGDENTHGNGKIIVNDQDCFRIGGKLVATIASTSEIDDLTHTPVLAAPQSGSSVFRINGNAIHRHNDSRKCGALTIATQDEVDLGG